ncbi:MAG: glycine cleavage system aminomethyltransferase GcvT [Bacillota bacterium]
MQKTALNRLHHELGAKMIDFGGWEMPVEYSGIIEEHKAVRTNCGIFDVSHMGEIEITGPGAAAYANKLVTNQVEVTNGKVVYTPMCHEDGGIVDDLLVYRESEDAYLFVVNASNKDKDLTWIQQNAPENVEVKDLSQKFALIALQGPKAEVVLQQLTQENLAEIKTFTFIRGEVKDREMIISRTGYTGEDGFELYLSPEYAEEIWQTIAETGEVYGLAYAGLGCRNTLRLEKALCLYGNDITEATNPLEAGLAWTVKFNKDEFIGKEALLEQKEQGISRKLVGFKLLGRGIARHGYVIEKNNEEIGFVTSGSFSPTLKENIGMGYVSLEYIEPGTTIDIKIRNREVEAEVVKLPFI